MNRSPFRPLSGVVLASLWPLLVASSCEATYPGIPESDRELFDQMHTMMMCATSDPAVDMAVSLPENTTEGWPAFEGHTRPGPAMDCLSDLTNRGLVHPLPDVRMGDIPGIGEQCPGVGVLACVHPVYNVCNEHMFIPSSLIPPTLTTIGPRGHGGKEAATATMLHLLYHEGIHTVQNDDLGDCDNAREIEAAQLTRNFENWLAEQLRKLGHAVDPALCVSLDEASANGLAPCVREFVLAAYPTLDTTIPIANPACADLHDQQGLAERMRAESTSYVLAERAALVDCRAAGAATASLVASSEDYDYYYAYFRGDSVIYQFQPPSTPGGSPSLVHSFSSTLNQISDLQLLRDSSGVEYLVISGVKAGRGAIAVRQDSQTGEFWTPPDGIMNGSYAVLTFTQLRSATRLVHAGTRPMMVWDHIGGSAHRLTFSSNIVSGMVTTPSFRLPVDVRGYDMRHRPDTGDAFVSIDNGTDTDTGLLHFADPQNDGIYALVDSGTADEIGILPPQFLSTPQVGRSGVWINLPPNHAASVHLTTSGGTSISVLGSATAGPSGTVWVPFSRPLATGEWVRPKDDTAAVRGTWVRAVDDGSPDVFMVAPWGGPPAGGTRVVLRGQGFSGALGVKFDSAWGSSLSIIDDRTLEVTTPAHAVGAANVYVVRSSGSTLAGAFEYRSTRRTHWTGSDLAGWTATGSGWSCSSTAIDAADVPLTGSRAGCQFSGGGSYAVLTSPSQSLTGQREYAVEIVHRGDFGNDGDGVVVQAVTATATTTLLPRGRVTRRVHAASCTGTGASRTCAADPPVSGLQGLAGNSWAEGGSAVPSVWRTDIYEFPPGPLDSGGSVSIRITATNASTAVGAEYQVSRVTLYELEPYDDRLSTAATGWTSLATIDSSCAGATVTAPFVCTSSPVTGANGSVFRYYNSTGSPTGMVNWPVNLTGVPGRRVRATVRHRADFTAGTSVGTGEGRVRWCCGSSCTYAYPVDGYSPQVGWQFNDEGPDGAVWMSDHFDLSAFAGQSCNLRLEGLGAVTSTQLGWVVDSIRVEWR